MATKDQSIHLFLHSITTSLSDACSCASSASSRQRVSEILDRPTFVHQAGIELDDSGVLCVGKEWRMGKKNSQKIGERGEMIQCP
jgi:hypothetical protein